MNRRLTYCRVLALFAAVVLLRAAETLRVVPWWTARMWWSPWRWPTRIRTRSRRRSRAACGSPSPLRRPAPHGGGRLGGSLDRHRRRERDRSARQPSTRRHSLSRTVDGRTDDAAVTEDDTRRAALADDAEPPAAVRHEQARTQSRALRPRQRPQAAAADVPSAGPARSAARRSSPSFHKPSRALVSRRPAMSQHDTPSTSIDRRSFLSQSTR